MGTTPPGFRRVDYAALIFERVNNINIFTMNRDFLSDEERLLLSGYEPNDRKKADRTEKHARDYVERNPYGDYMEEHEREKRKERVERMAESVLRARKILDYGKWENYKKDMAGRVREGFMDGEILAIIRYVEENMPVNSPESQHSESKIVE